MHKVNVVIIGGGIAGAGLAAAISEDCHVVVLEQENRAGYHSTGRSAAIYIESYGNSVIRTLNRLSRPFFDQPDTIGGGTLLKPRGMLLTATSADADKIDKLLNSSNAVCEVSTEQAMSLVPILRTSGFARAVYEAGASDIDVDRLHQGWLRLAQSHGASVKVNSGVTGIERHGNGWAVHSGSVRYEADIVVNAAGAWADTIAEMAGVQTKALTPLRRSAAIVQLSNVADVSHWPCFSEVNETWYAKPETNRLMVSPADEDPVPVGDAWVDDLVLAGGIDRFESAVTETVTRVEHSWAGLRTFAADKAPVVGYDQSVDGFFWLAGHGGYGIQTSPGLSQVAADLLLHKSVDAELQDSLSPMRCFNSTKLSGD